MRVSEIRRNSPLSESGITEVPGGRQRRSGRGRESGREMKGRRTNTKGESQRERERERGREMGENLKRIFLRAGPV